MQDEKEFIEQLIEKLDQYVEQLSDENDDNRFETALLIAEQLRQELLEISKNTL